MNLKIEFKNNCSADGIYTIKAESYDTAALYWADSQGMMSQWTAFGYVRLDSATGVGVFDFYGGRSIPAEADHVYVKAFRSDSPDFCEGLFPLERKQNNINPEQPMLRCGILTDLHLSRKAGAVKLALKAAADSDCILLPGDITNDGSEEEFKMFENCLNDAVSGVPVFSVSGNHDLMGGAEQYADFQNRRIGWQSEINNICYASFKGTDIIGINAGALWTKDIMRITSAQLEYLNSLLEQNKDVWKIVICHTPLSRNMPARNGHLSVYLSKDVKMQKIIDAHKQVIFLSGHTHLSPNLNSGVVSFDSERNNLYINCGSIRPTELGREAKTAPAEWKSGNITELTIMKKAVEIRMYTINTKKLISRGYCFFNL